ncbi:MAG: VUT family protein [Burkholderiales bacterium]|nr:VUT family protein [Burkholderiales bacterium]
MIVVVIVSNWLVQFPINDWLTWGAFSYPFAFLVSDLTNRRAGPRAARRVAWVGFAIAVVASAFVAPLRIACASGLAFICSQLFDIVVFNRLRQMVWWRAPLFASILASILDTAVFFGVAFAGSEMSWVMLAMGDLSVKLASAVFLLLPFRLLLPLVLEAPILTPSVSPFGKK